MVAFCVALSGKRLVAVVACTGASWGRLPGRIRLCPEQVGGVVPMHGRAKVRWLLSACRQPGAGHVLYKHRPVRCYGAAVRARG